MRRVNVMCSLFSLLSIALVLSACQPLIVSEDSTSSAADPAAEAEVTGVMLTVEERIANAMSAGPAPIAQDAMILDYPEEWPGNWPGERRQS